MKPNNSTYKSNQTRNGIISMLVAVLLLVATWYVLDKNSTAKHLSMANTLAKMLAHQAADQVLADDMLALQNIVRRTAQLPNVHYAGVYDAAGTPISEAGTVAGIANTFTASATVFAQETQLGIASISVETPQNQSILVLFILPVLAGLIGFLQTPRPIVNTEAVTATHNFTAQEPLLYIYIQGDYADFADQGAAAKLDQAATLIAKLYGARTEKSLSGYVFRFDQDKDPTTRACCMARLWYGSFKHYKQQAGFNFGAAALLTAYPSLNGNALQQEYEHNCWLLDTHELVRSKQGIMLNYEFMSLQDVAQNVVVRDDIDHYRLKSLNPTLDKLVRKQLGQVVKTLSRK